MSMPAYIVLGIVVLISAAAVAVFNRMIRPRNKVRRAWKDIDVQLKLRHQLLPLLAQVAEGYAGHENEVLEEAARWRAEALAAAGVAERGRRELSLSETARKILLLRESYPELKADVPFAKLAEETVKVEDHLAAARKYYNGTVRIYNTFIQSFPINLLARLFRFPPAEYFQVEMET